MTHIWVPKAKIIEAKSAIATRSRSRYRGFFKMEAIRPDGRRRLLADWFPNLITNAGLNAIGADAFWMNTAKVGSGSTPPNILDTAMQSYVAGASSIMSTNTSAQATPPYYGQKTRVYRFAAGDAEGNLAEVGIGRFPTNEGVLWSRALILDSEGDPTVITVLEDEVLDVTYQLRLYPPLDDIVGTINISGSEYEYTLRAAAVTDSAYWQPPGASAGAGNSTRAYNGAIGAITTTPSGTLSSLVSSGADSYGTNNFYNDWTATWGLDDANFAGGIDSVMHAFGAPGSNVVLGAVQVGFSPAIPKDNTGTLSLTFRHSWARGDID